MDIKVFTAMLRDKPFPAYKKLKYKTTIESLHLIKQNIY